MIKTILSQYASELLYNLMLKNHITDNLLKNYAKLHMGEIMDMMDIFEHESERDRRLALTLFSLLGQDQGKEVVGFYSREYNLSDNLDFDREDVLLLLTACKMNPAFFSYALSVCEDIKSELASANDKKFSEEENAQMEYQIVEMEPSIEEEKTQVKYKIIELTFFFPIEEPNAAAPADDDYKEFFSKSITYKDFNGTLHFMGDTDKRVYLEFVFDKYQKKIPFELELCFTTTRDHKEHVIVIPSYNPLRDEETNFTAIRSDEARDIDYSGGIEPNYKISLKLLP